MFRKLPIPGDKVIQVSPAIKLMQASELWKNVNSSVTLEMSGRRLNFVTVGWW